MMKKMEVTMIAIRQSPAEVSRGEGSAEKPRRSGR